MFTTRDVQKGEFILEYSGELLTAAEAEKREESYDQQGVGNFLFFFGDNSW